MNKPGAIGARFLLVHSSSVTTWSKALSERNYHSVT